MTGALVEDKDIALVVVAGLLSTEAGVETKLGVEVEIAVGVKADIEVEVRVEVGVEGSEVGGST